MSKNNSHLATAATSIMIAREYAPDAFSYECFDSLKSLHAWMCTVDHRSNRTAYMVDTSTTHKAHVSALVFELEWLSSDDLPDPVAGERLQRVQTKAVQALGPFLPHNASRPVATRTRMHFGCSFRMSCSSTTPMDV